MTRRLTWLSLTALALGVSCAHGTSTPLAPTAAPPGSPQALAEAATSPDTALAGLAIYRVALDPESLEATTTLLRARSGQQNDDLYLLPVDAFFAADDFRIDRISRDSDSVDITYTLVHPFDAPTDLDAPATRLNRIDLAVCGMTTFLFDVPAPSGNTYFAGDPGGTVIANTELVMNPDAYYQPAGLLPGLGLIANTFPYKVFVNEAADNRQGISNNGSMSGNYDPASGWQRSNIGADFASWTGYGVLHQGQRSTSTVSLNRSALAGTPMEFDVALIAKYNDPRGGGNSTEKRANRLPSESGDVSLFTYRMPHGALDVEAINFVEQDVPFEPGVASFSTLSFQVTDWDARAEESTQADLVDETIVSKVAQGEAGLPGFAVSIPGILDTGDGSGVVTWDPLSDVLDDDTLAGGDPSQDSGRPDDRLFYQRTVAKGSNDAGLFGFYTGMARATDPEVAAITDPNFILELEGDLTPLSGNFPQPVTYQHFQASMGTPSLPPSVTVQGPAGMVASGTGILTLQVTAYSDPENDPIQIQFDWNDDGDFADVGESYQLLSGPTPLNFNAPIFYENTAVGPDLRQVAYRYTDGTQLTPLGGLVNWTLSGNQPPSINVLGTVGLLSQFESEPATFTVDAAALSVSDPELDPISFTVRATPASGPPVVQSGILTLHGYSGAAMGPYTQAQSPITFEFFLNDALHPDTAGFAITTVPTPLVGTVTAPCSGPSLPSAGNVTLATLTTGNVLRTGTASNQPITGVRVGWSPVAGAGNYSIYRGEWQAGTNLGSVSFGSVGTVAAGTTTFDDTTLSAAGKRYVYKVNGRCGGIGTEGPDSELAMIALQNFETAPVNQNALTTATAGWIGRYRNANPSLGGTDAIYTASGALNGGRDLRIQEFGTAESQMWFTYSPPGLSERGLLGALEASIFEFHHSYNGAGGTQTGATVLTNAALPTNGLSSGLPDTWRWAGSVLNGSFGYNDSGSSTFTSHCFGNIAGQVSGSWNWGTSGGAYTEQFSRLDASAGTIGDGSDFVFLAFVTTPNGAAEVFRLDDMAWIVY